MCEPIFHPKCPVIKIFFRLCFSAFTSSHFLSHALEVWYFYLVKCAKQFHQIQKQNLCFFKVKMQLNLNGTKQPSCIIVKSFCWSFSLPKIKHVLKRKHVSLHFHETDIRAHLSVNGSVIFPPALVRNPSVPFEIEPAAISLLERSHNRLVLWVLCQQAEFQEAGLLVEAVDERWKDEGEESHCCHPTPCCPCCPCCHPTPAPPPPA